MIFEPAVRTLLPTKDLLSYIFDEPEYDQDQPVSDSAASNTSPPAAELTLLDLY
jgi:hypothetical protein